MKRHWSVSFLFVSFPTRTIRSGSTDLSGQSLKAQPHNPPLHQGTLRWAQWKCKHPFSLNQSYLWKQTLSSLWTGSCGEAKRSRGNPKDSTERLWDVQEGFSRDGEQRISSLSRVVPRWQNWALVPAAPTGGYPAAAPEQRGAGGVSLEGETGGVAGRAPRGTKQKILFQDWNPNHRCDVSLHRVHFQLHPLYISYL